MKNKTPLVLYYGISGLGKTTAALYAIPNAIFIAAPGALTPAETQCGISLDPKNVITNAKTFVDVIEQVRKNKGRPIVIDDATILAEQSMLAEMKKAPRVLEGWQRLYHQFLTLREEARYNGSIILANAHLRDPMIDFAGKKQIGGPDFPGQGRKKFPSAFDLSLHVESRQRQVGWGMCCRVRTFDPDYVPTKDRFNIAVDGAPANIGELLRAYGIDLPRVKELSNKVTEDLIASGAQAVEQSLQEKIPLRGVAKELWRAAESLTKNPAHVEWIVKDALDRGEIRFLREGSRRGLYIKGGK